MTLLRNILPRRTSTVRAMSSLHNKSASTAAAAAMVTGGFVLGLLFASWQWRKKKSGENRNETHPAPRRFGGAIRLKRDQYQRYRELHDEVWPQVLERMYQSHIRNFQIFFHNETSTLYQSFDWIGHWYDNREDEGKLFERDMQAIANDPITRQWWTECEPCQEPFHQWNTASKPPPSLGGSGDWWAPLECVCHAGHWPTSYSMERHDPDFAKLKQNEQD